MLYFGPLNNGEVYFVCLDCAFLLCTVYCVLCTVYCVLCTVYCVLLKLNDKPIQYREVHGNESELFKGYFREMQIWSGG